MDGEGDFATATLVDPAAEGVTARGVVLVTGAAGFLGTHVCRELAERGWQVRAMVRDTAKAERRLAGVPIELEVGDLRDKRVLPGAVRGAAAIVHLAAIAVERPGQTYEDVNARATEMLVHAAKSAGVPRFVHLSQNGASSASPYRFLRSKGVAEDCVRESGLAWTSLRPSVIFGPEDEFVNVLARLVRLSPVVYPVPGGGHARFQPVAVGDVARATARALERDDTIGHAYGIGGPAALTLRQMVERVLLAMRTTRVLIGVPVAVLRPIVAVMQRVLPTPPVTTSLLDLLAVDNTVADNALESVFGVEPTPFAAEELRYLESITAEEAWGSLWGRGAR